MNGEIHVIKKDRESRDVVIRFLEKQENVRMCRFPFLGLVNSRNINVVVLMVLSYLDIKARKIN